MTEERKGFGNEICGNPLKLRTEGLPAFLLADRGYYDFSQVLRNPL